MSSIGRPGICASLISSAKYQFSTSSASFKSHYDTLGIHPKSTQSDIKSAYYELTKVYHPDKNSTEEAKSKFRDITDAYEILSNYKSRKMYDRGMRPGERRVDTRDPEEKKKEDAQTRFYRSRMNRSRVPSADGRTPIYNFDEWAKAHYGDLLNQNLRAKEDWEFKRRFLEEQSLRAENNRFWVPIMMLCIMLGTAVFTSAVDQDSDRNRIVDKTGAQTSGSRIRSSKES